MSEMRLDSNQLKAVLKSAIVELLQENRQEISDLLAEIIEDIAMERAIKESETTKPVSREAIFRLLGKA
ncbi:hypothetical protein ACQ4M3_35555 [Leptolyngbya sp. AN03gr2]|uniref:hypothetical protein n=1 Tax=unclassified Leptolyngbya TaxID=2650499 RepID=UPI003D31F811